MADSRFLDRLIRGRLWIPLVAAGLMGIVFMQVSMLKLNAGIGRAVQSAPGRSSARTPSMRAQVSGMESGSQIYATATDLGMVAPARLDDAELREGRRRRAGDARPRTA